MARQSSSRTRGDSKERKFIENSPYSKNFKCYVKSDQKELVFKRQMVTKLTRKELEDKYIDLCDENFFIKRQNNENLEKIKVLQTKLVRLSEGHRCFSSASILRENFSNVMSNKTEHGSKELLRSSSMNTIYKQTIRSGGRSKENSARPSAKPTAGCDNEEKGDHEESEKLTLMKVEVSKLRDEIDRLKNTVKAEQESSKNVEADKNKLEEQLSRVEMHKFLAENAEINRLRNKYDELRRLVKRLQEKNKKLLAKKDNDLRNERNMNRQFQVQMKFETLSESDLSEKEMELKVAARTIEVLRKQISELELDKKSLVEQQERLSGLLKNAAFNSKLNRVEIHPIDNQGLLQAIEQLTTEKAAIESSKNEMFKKIQKLQDINDELLVQLEGYKTEKTIHDDFIILNAD